MEDFYHSFNLANLILNLKVFRGEFHFFRSGGG